MGSSRHYSHSAARGGGNPHVGKHDAALRQVTGKTSHLVGGGSEGKRAAGDLPPQAKTPPMTDKGQMAKVKKIAGGSNY